MYFSVFDCFRVCFLLVVFSCMPSIFEQMNEWVVLSVSIFFFFGILLHVRLVASGKQFLLFYALTGYNCLFVQRASAFRLEWNSLAANIEYDALFDHCYIQVHNFHLRHCYNCIYNRNKVGCVASESHTPADHRQCTPVKMQFRKCSSICIQWSYMW